LRPVPRTTTSGWGTLLVLAGAKRAFKIALFVCIFVTFLVWKLVQAPEGSPRNL
jgi:hypothetical protein